MAKLIGGIFRDSESTTLLHFAKFVMVNSAIEAEVMAIREAILVAVVSRRSTTSTFGIESDFPNVVGYLANPFAAPWKFPNTLQECSMKFDRNITWSLSHIRCIGNEAIDVLSRIRVAGMNFIEFA